MQNVHVDQTGDYVTENDSVKVTERKQQKLKSY